MKHLPLPACRGFELVVPPLNVQQQFSAEIRAIEAVRTSAEVQLEVVEALFASLQGRAFTGAL